MSLLTTVIDWEQVVGTQTVLHLVLLGIDCQATTGAVAFFYETDYFYINLVKFWVLDIL